MAQSKSFFDDVKKEIECPVCQEQFSETKEPKILKCFHTFCKSCLEGWLRQQGGGALSCPKCRRITECPNDDINSLPSNLFYKQMVDIVEAYSAQGQEDAPYCGNCDERKSLKFYCADCNHFLCEDCAGAHKKMKTLSGHQVKEIGKFKASDARDYARRANACKQHNDEVRFFCEQCKTCICRDCAILDHEDHKKMSLEKGLEKKKSDIQVKLREVQVNGSRLSTYKDSLEKRRLKVNNCFEQATKEVREAAECCINLIRRHEESVTERLMKQKESFEDEFVNKMANVDGKLAEIGSSLEFGDEVLSRNNLPEILNVEEMLEKRLQELSIPFEPMFNFPGVRYTPNDMSSLTDALGKLHTTNTEPSLSVAEGQGLTEAIQSECSTFTVITKDAHNQTTYSDIDEIEVTILSEEKETLKTNVTDCKNGQYLVKYKSDVGGDFNVYISVRGQAIMGSPFNLAVAKKTTKDSATGGGGSSTKCPICLDTLTNARTLKCKHVFCTDCVETALKRDNRCPVCKEVQGVMRGNQPAGQMHFLRRREHLPDCGTIVIDYYFPPGTQGKEHPNPGQWYNGTQRNAYLPDNREGNEVLRLLKRAFDARLVFTVGASVAIGMQNQITWNDIHHKTSTHGGPQGFGYPDPDYLRRVKEDLAAKGIR